MQGYASREAVLNILLDQEETGAFLKDLFPRHADSLPGNDRALAREISLGVLRNRSLLDFNIDRCTPRKPGPGLLRTLLRLTAYQLFFMDVPAFAAVNVAVELAKRRGGREKAGFVNAVLKKLSAEGLQRAPGNTLKSLSTNYSHPLWLVERWHKRLGPKGLLKALERNNQEAPLWIRINPDRGDIAGTRQLLADLGALEAASEAAPETAPAAILATAPTAGEGGRTGAAGGAGGPKPAPGEPEGYAGPYLRLAKGAGEKVLRSESFASGAIAFQDPAAWLVAELADWRPGSPFLDLCSAPGGKAACMVERASLAVGSGAGPADGLASGPDGRGSGQGTGSGALPRFSAVCNDLSFRRLRRIKDARERLGHGALMPVVMDPAHAALRRRFDLVVVDAPCSNLGVIRRRPEARWSHSPKDLERLAGMQKALLGQAASLTAAGGCIVYATCSPEPEESAAVVEAFLADNPGWMVESAASRLPAWAVKSGFLWLHPGETEYDGFFAARLRRKADA